MDGQRMSKTIIRGLELQERIDRNWGIVLKGSNIFIPKACRKLMLEIIHDAHLGVEKFTHRARVLLFWPNMTTDIKSALFV